MINSKHLFKAISNDLSVNVELPKEKYKTVYK